MQASLIYRPARLPGNLIVVMGLTIFLSVGFVLAGLAKAQQSIQSMVSLVTIPQVLLSGIFFPIANLPGVVQPVARVLPLTLVVEAMREIVIDGARLLQVLPAVAGIGAWAALSVVAASRYFVWKEVAR